MSRHTKIITLLSAIIFCFSLFTFTSFAVDDPNTGENPGSQPGVDEPITPEIPDTPISQPEQSDDPVSDVPSYVEPDQSSDYNYSDSSESYYDYDYNNDNSESSSMYVGGGQSYAPPASTAPSVPLYNSNHKIDENTLSNKDWKDIAANLKNASMGSEDDSDDFGFIKNNDSLYDNGEWMLFAGIACLALGAAGIIYVIISTVNKHKKLGAKQYAYASSPSNGRYSSGSNYADNYSYAKPDKKRLDKSRKFDTADVKISNSSSGSHYKNGGTRYR